MDVVILGARGLVGMRLMYLSKRISVQDVVVRGRLQNGYMWATVNRKIKKFNLHKGGF